MGLISATDRFDDERATRVLVLTRYGRMGASSRIRFEQFVDSFRQERGGTLSFDIKPLLDEHYLNRLYGHGRRDALHLVKRYMQRIGVLLGSHRYDAVWIEKEILPGVPAVLEWALARLGVPTIVDFDDATFLFYEVNSNPVVRWLMSSKIDQVFRSATIVTAGNGYLAQRARQGGGRRVIVLPTVVAMDKYADLPSQRERSGPFTIGWIGTPSNARYLSLYAPALACAEIDHGARFETIGAPADVVPGVRQHALQWSEATEAQHLGRWHAAIAPLDWGPWELGKCAYKVLQSMAAGIPVIAAPVGVIPSIIEHGRNGFLAKDANECRAALAALAGDPELRHRIAMAGQQTVRARYSVEVAKPLVRQTLLEAVGSKVPAPLPLPEIPRAAAE